MARTLVLRGLLAAATICSLFGLSLLTVSGGGGNVSPLPVGGGGSVSTGPKVVVNVVAEDEPGNELLYFWRSTDGQIIDSSDPAKPSTEWILPAGGGIHFVYVLVWNGKGGYTEARIGVNTDILADRRAIPPPLNLVPPPLPASTAVPFRNWLGGGCVGLGTDECKLKVALPDVTIDTITRTGSPVVGEITDTSLSGDFTLQKFSPQPFGPLQALPSIGIECSINGINVHSCFGTDESGNLVPDEIVDKEANQTNRIDLMPTKNASPPITDWITGTTMLKDGSPCGTENEFFGVTRTAMAELLDINLVPIPGTQVRANSWGQFSIPMKPSDHPPNVVVHCEDAPSAGQTAGFREIPAPSRFSSNNPPDTSPSRDVGFFTVDASRPTVKSMSVTGQPGIVSGSVELADQLKGLPSDIVPRRPAKFLAMKGLDTRLSACRYYQAIGAVRDCDAQGNFKKSDAIGFEDWKRAVKIDQYAKDAPPGTVQQARALFINKVDLNLTRDHHFVSHLAGTKAGYVCNHLGPDPKISDRVAHQDDVDKTIQNTAAGLNLVACVAMDYSRAPGVNTDPDSGQEIPFIRFLIFGPSGELLPSVNLDGLGEKFVPGACVVCHGGNKYAGKFPEDGSGTADLEAHFLPFDVGNFEFHSGKGGLTITDQEGRKLLLKKDADVQEGQDAAISRLNDLLLSSAPGIGFFGFDKGINQAEKELIVGWYKSGLPVQDINFVPDGTMDSEFYLKVIARNCRTCHIAQRDEQSIKDLNFSKMGSNSDADKHPGALNRRMFLKELVCGQTNDLLRAYAMPNSKVTFDLFWTSPEAVKELREQTGVADCANPKAPQTP